MTIQELFGDKPERWTRETFAVTADGGSCDPRYGDAVAWCLRGALVRCYPDQDAKETAREALRNATHAFNLATWNDAPERTFADIQRVVREANV